jgi:hypothetical protein
MGSLGGEIPNAQMDGIEEKQNNDRLIQRQVESFHQQVAEQ